MKIIALDPGKNNFAAAVMEDYKVLETRYIDTIKSLKKDDFDEESRAFRENYFEFLSKINPDFVLAERFMARPGAQQGSVGEYINIMLGIVSTINSSKGIPTHLVTSSQWKNYMTARYGAVKDMKEHFKHLSVHEADALAIAVYFMENEFDEKGKILKKVRRLRRYPHVGKTPKISRKRK